MSPLVWVCGLSRKCFLLFALIAGCSASERIATEASGIGERAGTIHRLAVRIGERSEDPDIISDAAQISTEAVAISRGTQAIHIALPGVVDREPWWSNLLKWLAIAATGAALVWAISATGVASAIRVALGWLPRRKVTDAEMAVATLSQDRPETMREYIAMRRGTDREFDAAWRKANAESVQSSAKGV